MSEHVAQRTPRSLPAALRYLHWFLIANFVGNILYASYQVFFALAPEGHSGPLWAGSAEIPFELLVSRRLYAIEAWVTIGGFAIYVAVTEILPRLLARTRSGGG